VKKVIRKGSALVISAAMLATMIPTGVQASNVGQSVSISFQSENHASSANVSSEGIVTEIKGNDSVAAAISKTKAEELVRQYVNIPKEYKLQSVYFSTDNMLAGKRNIWGMDFIKQVNGKHQGSIHAAINADNGQLVSFNSYSNDVNRRPSYPLKVERDAAQEIALSFIKEVASDYASVIQINEYYGAQLLPALTGEVRHNFRFDRIVNNIPFLDNYMNITVDSDGHIVEYGFVWDDTIEFPKISSYLTVDQANAALRSQGETQLKYVIPYGGQGKKQPRISYYVPEFSIDAVTGKKSEQPQNYYNYRLSGEVAATPLTDKPLSAKPTLHDINEQQAITRVTNAFKLPEGAEIQNSSYNEYVDSETGQSNKIWNLYWILMKDKKEIGSVWASVNGQSGAIQSYSYYYNQVDTSNKAVIPLEKAVSTAIEVVKQQLPWLTNELYVITPDSKQYENPSTDYVPEYYISFMHKIHGADIDYDRISVSIDSRTGEVKRFDANINTYEYASKAPTLISKEAAIDKWMDYYRTELTYRLVNDFKWSGNPIPFEKYNLMLASGELNHSDQVERTTKVELIYRLVPKALNQQVFLDATSGEWRSYELGEVASIEKTKLTDVEGHWAQHQLELMVAYKALDVVNGKVRPNEQIKRGELIKMLVLARNGGNYYGNTIYSSSKNSSFADVAASSEYFAYIENALEQNLIDLGDGSFNPEGTVTREEMAELIVRALGYNSLAKVDHIFVDNFKDSLDIKNKGQAAIVVGLNIMSLTGDKFNPQKKVQRAEAAAAFFRYLQSRADLQEAPLRM